MNSEIKIMATAGVLAISIVVLLLAGGIIESNNETKVKLKCLEVSTNISECLR